MSDFASLPSLFDSRGVFRPLSDDLVGTLDQAHATTYEKIKQCADAIAAVENKAAFAIEHVKASADAVRDFQKYIAATFPPLGFHDLWKANFSRKP
jgi:hypothetical protein